MKVQSLFVSRSDGRGQKSQRTKSQKTPKTNPYHYFGENFFISVLKSLISILSNVWVSALDSNSKYPKTAIFQTLFDGSSCRSSERSSETGLLRTVSRDIGTRRISSILAFSQTLYLVCDCMHEHVMLYFFNQTTWMKINSNKLGRGTATPS